jgi:uncharacterized protein YbjT (DUF2867 family)
MKVLVIGATGRVGTEVVKALLQRGAGVRALTRKQSKPDAFPDAVEIALGDLNEPASTAEAMKGVDKLFLLIGSESVPVELMQALIAYGLAKKAGLKHVTYVSVYRADQFIEVPHFASKYAVEEAMRAGGMPYTILRPAYFTQNERSLRPGVNRTRRISNSCGKRGPGCGGCSRPRGGGRDIADRRGPQRQDVRSGFIRDVAWSECGGHMVEATGQGNRLRGTR